MYTHIWPNDLRQKRDETIMYSIKDKFLGYPNP